jgi:hypothetical protein
MVFGWLSDGRTSEEADAADMVSLVCCLVLKWDKVFGGGTNEGTGKDILKWSEVFMGT